MTTYNYVWLRVATCGYVWLRVTTYNSTLKLLSKAAYSVQLLSEWASLESLCLAIIALFANIDQIVSSMSSALSYDKALKTGPQ